MRTVLCAISLAAVGACGTTERLTQPRASFSHVVAPPRYRVATLPTLGGASQGGGINSPGWVAGYSGLPDGTRHAALWRNGSITDLGTLGGTQSGLHSNVQWPGLNDDGMVVGVSHTGALDPLGEAWSCSAFMAANGHTCLGFVWHGGVMTALPTLGGSNGFAAGVNDAGQVVGWAETPLHDPTCNAPQVLQFRAVLWEPKSRRTTELPPLSGDSTSAATAINAKGQVVGISDPPGGDIDADNLRAFLWTKAGGMKDLGMLSGDGLSEALDINNRGQIVGVSCGDVCHAVLWQDGVMYKLQDLVGPGFSGLLWSARSINDAGQITGRLIDLGTGRALPYVATPVTTTP